MNHLNRYQLNLVSSYMPADALYLMTPVMITWQGTMTTITLGNLAKFVTHFCLSMSNQVNITMHLTRCVPIQKLIALVTLCLGHLGLPATQTYQKHNK
jgi:hypothetical protein